MDSDKKLCRTAQALADATGVSRYTIQAIRKAGRLTNDPLPNYCTPGEVRSWLRRHPHFVARNVFKNEELPENWPNTEVESSAPEADLAAIRHHAQWAADRKSAEFLRALCDELERRRASSIELGGVR